ncbi:PACE efflux transporter [Pseudomonas viciae]|uniref:PACE efflux transporter n=1 Tax=Pseudomonas viciae TaxID=2505979 RepID=A0ABY8P909_9PSED|nr:PACE efflux transporter [Pseudomonas viciae]UZE84761.1 PACE efflux transporter [Pseudomonas viciae]WGO91673.1 PACE efflux transporter [Pseudomonas viciae]
MQGTPRKILQAILYEAGGVLFVAPALALTYGQGMGYSTLLSLVISAVALAWNMLFNGLFEWWERRQRSRHRNWLRRLLHSLGFEGGLTLILTPVIGAWLGISLWLALATNLGLFVFFFFYSLVFQWGFDRVFDVPLSAQSGQGPLSNAP